MSETIRFITLDPNITMFVKPGWEERVGTQVVNHPPHIINFNGAYYDTDNETEIQHLRKHSTFGTRIFEEVAPDDVVSVMTETKVYICGFPKCKSEFKLREALEAHKQEEHSREARMRKLAESRAIGEELVEKKKKKARTKEA
jgi:hypothetical protein